MLFRSHGSQFVVAGAGGTLLYGTDGATWTTATSGTTADLYALLYGSDFNYFAAGSNGVNLLSE